MVDSFIESPGFRNSSKYWNYLNRLNIQDITQSGFDNFKQTVARHYFTWVGTSVDTPYTHTLLKEVGAHSLQIPISSLMHKHDLFTLDESVMYNLVTALLYEFVSLNVDASILKPLEEPEHGNPPAIRIGGKLISQDLLNSALEVSSLISGVDLKSVKTVIEVGAGSGRTSYALMTLFPQLKYVVTDIPPALYISQSYLTEQFPGRKTFKFRPFKTFEEVEREFSAADLCFIMPHQLELLPAKYADVFLAIDCLHEMKREQIQEYFDSADRMSKAIYFKCWNDTMVPFDGIRLRMEDYPVKTTWKQTYRRQCKIPSTFFEAFYQID